MFVIDRGRPSKHYNLSNVEEIFVKLGLIQRIVAHSPASYSPCWKRLDLEVSLILS
ncbi:hypothetical protein CDL15_Pgr011675 [Punica granatum]|uniref:Uncharacterized protein n=1 Tax=Punica granatum TaxID=22663 RepID=A0A218WX54_PUNGR|nr:hypothetical protein CDL15_Pgr011675 [Punica granatum]